ncbi:MAG: DUF456 domain-containing protein [Candidatus Nanohaloarchaea archaeon]
MELVSGLILVLLLAGVVGSIVPMMPGAVFSLAAVLIYFFRVDDPSLIFTVFGAFTSGFALLVDWFAGAVAAKYGGASRKTSMAAAVTGLIGFIFLGGPIGLALAVSATVFIREYMIHGDGSNGAKAAVYATIGVLGSAFVQAMLTGSVLLAYALTYIL